MAETYFIQCKERAMTKQFIRNRQWKFEIGRGVERRGGDRSLPCPPGTQKNTQLVIFDLFENRVPSIGTDTKLRIVESKTSSLRIPMLSLYTG